MADLMFLGSPAPEHVRVQRAEIYGENAFGLRPEGKNRVSPTAQQLARLVVRL